LGEKFIVLADIVKMAYNVAAFAFFGARTTNPLSRTEAALNEAEKAYKPGVINTPITLFNSKLPWGVTEDETLGWQSHSRAGVDVHSLPTIFDLMIESRDVKIAAEHLREVLDQKFAAQNEQRATQVQ
jgi:hypothetical protein